MAYIQKRQHPNGISYRARVRISGMPDKSATFSSRTQAKIWAQKMEAEIRQGRYFPRQEDKERTFADLVNRYLAALSKALTIAIKEWGWLKENPIEKISRPREAKPRERYLEKEEITLLMTECKKCKKSPYLYPIVLFALATGARLGEILNLKWDDVDFIRSIATFRETKNGETRSVPLSNIVLTTLKEEAARRLIASEYLFPNRDGSKPTDIRTAWDQVLKKTNLKNVCFHSLRHTAASQLAQRGASTLEIAAILGHKTLAMVKRYSHFSTSSTAQALFKMNEELLHHCVND